MIPTQFHLYTRIKIAAVLLCALAGTSAFAGVTFNNGVFDVDVSGYDGGTYGQDGDNGGQIELTLAYADAAKTQVKITGTTRAYGHTTTIAQTLALTDLKKITLEAYGGNGAAGQDGTNGQDGWDGQRGWDGSSGCPPQPGGDGTDGADGRDGGNGSNGGSGGDGGKIHVRTSADETELMLLVKMHSAAGDAGLGGRGGSGGHGGRGGAGGNGGTNTCNPKGDDAPNGHNGRDGYDGRSGYSGGNGYSGRDGVSSYDVVNSSGAVVSYDGPFELSFKATMTQDIDDGVLEPGEKLDVTSLEVTNTGEMPTPAGQVVHLVLTDSATLQILSGGSFDLNQEIPPGGAVKLNLKTGDFTIRVRDDGKLVGQPAVLASEVTINHLSTSGAQFNTGTEVRWPVVASASLDSVNSQFESVTSITYTFKNISTKDIGPKGIQPLAIGLTWVSDNIPASAVTVILADGRRFNLSQPAVLRDISVPAGKTIAFTVPVAVRDANSAKKGNGAFEFGLILKSLVDGHERTVQKADTVMNFTLDLYNLAFDQAYDLTAQKMSCVFKNRGGATLPISGIHFTKAKGGTEVMINLSTPSSGKPDQSPTYKMASHLFFPYLENFEGDNTAAITLDLLNKTLAIQSSGSWAFASCK